MKKLSEMHIAKDALLSKIETSAKGGHVSVGAGTNYYGPSNPSSITTYLDGVNIGSDGMWGNIGGDAWVVDYMVATQASGTMTVASAPATGG